MPVIRGSKVRIINETSGRDIPLSLFGFHPQMHIHIGIYAFVG